MGKTGRHAEDRPNKPVAGWPISPFPTGRSESVPVSGDSVKSNEINKL
ncbi:hypothetical protein AYI68_g4898, partial [Smittium mucronatum]